MLPADDDSAMAAAATYGGQIRKGVEGSIPSRCTTCGADISLRI